MMERIARTDRCACHSGREFGKCCGKDVAFDEDGNTYHVSLTDRSEPETGSREGFVIVKVQIELTNLSHPALIYDRGRTFRHMVEPTQVIMHMKGRPKAFFYAQLKYGQVVLGDEAPEQRW
jgi:hypothetical protein